MRNLFLLLFLLLFGSVQAQYSYGVSADQNVYELDPEAYGILQGTQVTYDQAFNNRIAFEEAMQDAKDAGYKVFKVSNFDAMFEVTKRTNDPNPNYYPFEECINTVSGLDLDFRENATFRIFPNSEGRHALFGTAYSKNLTIKGGIYIGDRLEHTGGDQRGHLIHVIAGTNILVEGTHTSYGHGDGLVVSSRYQYWHENYAPSTNVIIRNSIQEYNRRQGISLTDGSYITVEYCEGYNNGTDLPDSNGSLPRCWLDIEAQRRRDSITGQLILDEHIDNVLVRRNKERGSDNAGILMHIGNDGIIEENDVETGIVFDMGHNWIIRDNYVHRTDQGGTGINMQTENESTYNNLVENNYVTGYSVGLNVGNGGTTARYNEFYQTNVGLRIKGGTNAIIEDNIFESTVPSSIGVYYHVTTANNVLVKGNTFKSARDGIATAFANNNDPSFRTTLENNIFEGTRSVINLSGGFIFLGNKFNHEVRIGNSNDIIFQDQNIINSPTTNGLIIQPGNNNIAIRNSTINSTGQAVRIEETPPVFDFKNNTLNGVLQDSGNN